MSVTKFGLITIFILFITKGISIQIPKIKRMECPLNPKLCFHNTCFINAIRGRVTLVNVGCYLPEPLQNFTISFRFGRLISRRYQILFEYSENGCKILQNGASSPIAARLIGSLVNCMSQVPKKCPVIGNVTGHNCVVDLAIFPNIFPNGNYRSHMRFFNGGKYQNESIFEIILYIVVGNV